MMAATLLAESRDKQRQVQDVTGHSECSLKHNKHICLFPLLDDITANDNKVGILESKLSPFL
jgi:hypothetical protein